MSATALIAFLVGLAAAIGFGSIYTPRNQPPRLPDGCDAYVTTATGLNLAHVTISAVGGGLLCLRAGTYELHSPATSENAATETEDTP